MPVIFLTAIRESPQKHEDKSVPKVVAVDTAKVIKLVPQDSTSASYKNTFLTTSQDKYIKRYTIAESIGEYYLMADFANAASSPYRTGVSAGVAAAGTAQATATAITAYHNSVTAACASPSLFGVKLPNASTTGNLKRSMVVKNGATAGIQVYASASEYLDSSSASTSSATINAGDFKHFYCSSSTKWVTCRGPYF